MTDKQLLTETAQHLAGKPVVIRMRAPFLVGASGLAHKTTEGLPVVDIRPGMTPEATLKFYLHELAHVRLGHALTYTTDLEPDSKSFTPTGAAIHDADPDEAAAEKQAAAWSDYCQKYAWMFELTSVDQFEACCKALQFWPGALMNRQDFHKFMEDTIKQTIKESFR